MSEPEREVCPDCGIVMAFHTHPGSCRLPIISFSNIGWPDEDDALWVADESQSPPVIRKTARHRKAR